MRILLPLALSLLAAGCLAAPAQDDRDSQPSPPTQPTGPECAPVAPETVNAGVDVGNSGSVSNERGAFSFSRQGVVTAAKWGYSWENPSGQGRFSGSLQGSGNVNVKLYDSCGTLVLDRTLDAGSSSSSEALPAAQAGPWTVQITFTSFSGSASVSITA